MDELERIAAALPELTWSRTRRIVEGRDHVDGLLDRAWTCQCWIGVYMLTDHFDVGRTSWETGRETFDRVRAGRGR